MWYISYGFLEPNMVSIVSTNRTKKLNNKTCLTSIFWLLLLYAEICEKVRLRFSAALAPCVSATPHNSV